MRLIMPSDFVTQRWKNGGGVTHEIAREDRGDRLLWRMSIAEVASDGPFSPFPGLSRILTVIEGAGLVLESPEGALSALPLMPLAFSGDLAVTCRRIGGDVRDFNLIHDAARVRGEVAFLPGAPRHDCPPAPGRDHALLSLGPGWRLDGHDVPEGSVALFAGGVLTAAAQVPALLVTLDDPAA